MIRKRKIVCSLLAAVLLFPWYALPVTAQVDAKPQLEFDLWVLSWDDISVDTGGAIMNLLDPIGIKINVVPKDDDPMYEGIYQEPRTFGIYEMSHGYSSIPEHVYWRMHSENIVDWGSNCYGINETDMDEALDEFMTATPATIAEKARVVQVLAKDYAPYIPLFLSDDTHAIRAEWTNYTPKPGGVFTAFNPQTMVFMYNTTTVHDGSNLFVMAYSSDIGELNPMFFRSERSHWYDMLVYDTLITYDLNLNPMPWLADTFYVSDDGLRITYKIRTGATWHDGQPLTPEDVAFTFNYYKNGPEDATNWPFLQHLTNITVSGQNVTVTMDAPYTFGLQFLGDLYILPKHIREGIPADDERWNDPANVTAQIGSGMYKYVERVEDEYTLITRNPSWWGAGSNYVGQLPNIENVRIDVVRSQDARILAMRAGDADTERYEVFGAYVSTVLEAPELDLITGVASQWDYVIGFNMTSTPYSDAEVRKAICYAMDRQYLIDVGRLGFGTPTNSTIPYEYFPSYYNEDGVFYEYNITTANAILEDAGYIDVDGDGIREYPGVAPPVTGVDPLLIVGVGAGALIVGVVITALVMKKK